MKHLPRLILPLLIMLAIVPSQLYAQDSLTVIATTTIVADVAANVSGGLITVESLLPPGADTHAYQPTLEDASRTAQADLLLTVGIGYESFLGGLLENVGENIPVVVISTGIDMIPYGEHDHADESLGILGTDTLCDELHADESTPEAEHDHGACDPHVWMNPLNVRVWAANIADAFAALDPANAETYRANAAAYSDQLDVLDQELTQLIAQIPEARRVLITNHEFMGYFAVHYGFEVAATVLPGGTTGAEVAPQALADLIALVQTENVPAIFAEVSANPELANLIASESGASVVTTLYSEALSDPTGNAPTYLDMMRVNVQTIVDALR